MRKVILGVVLAFAAAAGAVACKAGPRGPQAFEPTATERAAVAGLQAAQRELNAQGEEIVAAARARLGLPQNAKFGWDQSGKWVLYADAAPVASQ